MSTSQRPARVAIIGGGWAGLACAEHLSRVAKAQIEINLYEAASHLGGRARGLTWAPGPGQTYCIDNGQHLTVGAYHETFALLKRCGAPAWPVSPLIWAGVAQNADLHRSWKLSAAWLPIRALLSLFGPYAPKGWPARWSLSLVRTLLAMRRAKWQAPQSLTVMAWLTREQVPADLIAHFWQPLTEGALNTEIDQASMAVLMRVVKDTLWGSAKAGQVLIPPNNLSVDGVDWITQALQKRGVSLATGHRVCAISESRTVQIKKSDQLTSQPFDAVVIALPAVASRQLWESSGLAITPIEERWGQMETRAITTVWVACTAEQMAKLSHLPHWFVLDPQPDVPHLAQVAVKRPGILAFVISAQKLTSPPAHEGVDSVQALLNAQVAAQLGLDISQQPQKWITEKTATWACDTQTLAAGPIEAKGLTHLQLIFRAADDLEPGYPATIESAVRSGRRTAQTLLCELGLSKP